jgi:hypothetical protein
MTLLQAHRHAKHFINGRHAGAAFRDAVRHHGRHPLADGELLDFAAIGARANAFPDIWRNLENLKETLAAAVAGEAAPLATLVMVKNVAGLKSENPVSFVSRNFLRRQATRRLTVPTEHAHEALANDRFDAGREQKAFDAKIDETGDRACSRVGMQGR